MMDDLISRAAAIDYLMTNMGWRDEDGYEVDDADEKHAIITDLINGIPAVDAVPVRHGRWTDENPDDYLDPRMKCSICTGIESPLIKWRYCPNCGAKMDGDGEARM